MQSTLLRYFRIALGAFIVAEAYYSGEHLFYLLGGILLLQGVFNMGCGMSSCKIPEKEMQNAKQTDISFEEVGKQ